MSAEEIEARLEDLEVLSAHQAQTIEDLSQELARAFETIDQLRRGLTALGHRFQELEEVATSRAEITKPPHY